MKSCKFFLFGLLALMMVFSCSPKPEEALDSSTEKKASHPVKKTEQKADHPMVLIQTNMGDITLELREDLTPVTVENFLRYVDDGFYDGKIFHRVIEGFMIQGGGFDQNMKKAPVRAPITNEAPKGLDNDYGTIAMARTSAIDSATAQFFINVQKNASLNHVPGDFRRYGYAAFGLVVKGMDVAIKINKVETGPLGMMRDVPLKPVVITKAVRLDKAASGA